MEKENERLFKEQQESKVTSKAKDVAKSDDSSLDEYIGALHIHQCWGWPVRVGYVNPKKTEKI